MTKYHFNIEHPNQQYVQIKLTAEIKQAETLVQLPSWRPGRYELGNFAKNVKGFKVFDQHGKKLSFQKQSKDLWRIETEGATQISVEYSYYAAQLNAGSTFLDANQLYVNPVNCCMYVVGKEHESIEVNLAIPEKWKIACSMEQKERTMFATHFDELADSPFICSADLQYNSYESFGTTFHVWFNGLVKPEWERLLHDFKAFTDKQIEKFAEFPTDHYHFLIHCLPIKAYHGVEHHKSTVISLGPSYDIFKSLYTELLGVSSHELYHTWNVKAIRPIEMFPYDFTKENYSRLGYLCEGVTTYMGDVFLLKSNVFNVNQYFEELKARLQVHFDNHARFNYSVAESSFDTWLDGYEPGAPNRKVSIYTEGCLLAFVMDVMILKATENKRNLDQVMKNLYFNFALKGKGVSESDYLAELQNVSGISFESFFEDYVYGCNAFEPIITEAFEHLGWELVQTPAKLYSSSRLGMKTVFDGQKIIVQAIYPGSPADLGGMMLGDQLLGLNGILLQNDLENWLTFSDDELKKFAVIRANRILELTLPEVNRNFYSEFDIKVISEPNAHQKRALEAWKK